MTWLPIYDAKSSYKEEQFSLFHYLWSLWAFPSTWSHDLSACDKFNTIHHAFMTAVDLSIECAGIYSI